MLIFQNSDEISELGNPVFQSTVIEKIPENSISHKHLWKELLMKICKNLHKLKNLNMVFSDEIIDSLKNYIINIFKEPNLPIPELYRDEYNSYKNTLLQEYLYRINEKINSCEFPEEFAKNLSEFIKIISDKMPEFYEQIKENSEDQKILLEIRWYKISKYKGKNLFIKILHLLFKTVKCLCKIILSRIKNYQFSPKSLLSEYSKCVFFIYFSNIFDSGQAFVLLYWNLIKIFIFLTMR